MTTLWTTVTKELGKPDDQGRDWYTWSLNQLGHFGLGVIGMMNFNITVVLMFAIGKEVYDFYQGGKWRDSVIDITFWSIGAFFTIAPGFLTVLLCIILLIGVYKRFKEAKRG